MSRIKRVVSRPIHFEPWSVERKPTLDLFGQPEVSVLSLVELSACAGMGVMTRSQAGATKLPKLPVTLLSGFLGAGGTARIKVDDMQIEGHDLQLYPCLPTSYCHMYGPSWNPMEHDIELVVWASAAAKDRSMLSTWGTARKCMTVASGLDLDLSCRKNNATAAYLEEQGGAQMRCHSQWHGGLFSCLVMKKCNFVSLEDSFLKSHLLLEHI